MAWQSGAVERLRGLQSPDVLLRMLMLPVVRGYSLCKTVVPAKAGELDQHFRCRIAQTPAQERGGSGESLNRLPVGPYELIVADAGYCSLFNSMGLMCWFALILRASSCTQHGADASPSSAIANTAHSRAIGRMVDCPAWAMLLCCRPVVCSTKERPCDLMGSPTLAS
jgi:hypothetical protein